jgi:hypothetical protein
VEEQPESLTAQLQRWTSGALITPTQAQSIAAYEQQRMSLGTAYGVSPGRISGVEILTTLAAGIVLIGVMSLIYASSNNVGTDGLLTTVVGLGAFLGVFSFRGRKTAAAARARASLSALGCAAVGIGVAELANSFGIFVTVTTQGTYYYSYQTANPAGDIVLGSVMVAALSIVCLLRFSGSLLTWTCIAGVYLSAGSLVSMFTPVNGQPDHPFTAGMVLLAGAVLLAIARWIVKREAQQQGMYFAAVAGTAVTLYLLGGSPWLYLDFAGAVIAIASLVAGLNARSHGFAHGGTVALGGLVFDIGGRNFATNGTVFSVYLICAGVLGIAAVVFVNRYLSGPKPAEPPQAPPG